MSILDKLKASRSVTRPVSLGEIKMAMRILTEQDYQDAGCAANDMLSQREVELSTANADLFESEKATHLLLRFLVDPDTRKPVFENAEQVRALLSKEDRSYIGSEYFDFEKEFSPSERTMSTEDFNALVDEVKKKPETPRMSDLSGGLLRKLVTTLAGQLVTLQTDNGFTSSP